VKVAFIVTHISHGSPGSFERVHEICLQLANSGISATILTPFAEDQNNIKDVDIHLLPSAILTPRMSSLMYKVARKMAASTYSSRIFLSDLSIRQMVKSVRAGLYMVLRKNKFDILHAVQPIAGLASEPIAREFNIPLMTDLHNIWPEEAVAGSLIKTNDGTFKRLHDIEQQIIDASDALTVVSEYMKSYILQNYTASNKRIIVVPPAGRIVSNTSKSNRQRNVVYAGMVNSREHVDLFARSIPFLKEPCSVFISNYGDAIRDIKKITDNIQHRSINYFWYLKRDQVLHFLMRSKIGILTSRNDITRQIGPPIKLYDYMMCGLPVVANDIGGWSEMIEKEHIGILTTSEPRDFAQSIDMIINDEYLWTKMHYNAITLITNRYNWEKIVKDVLIPIYQSLHKYE
jgi:colanic acid biosynthesis glycosyl transferase WcaI